MIDLGNGPRGVSRRTLLGTGAAALMLAGRPALAQQRQVALQLSWLHSVQFGGSYIARDRGYWTERGLAVALNPGALALAVTPNGPSSMPSVRVRPWMPILAAE